MLTSPLTRLKNKFLDLLEHQTTLVVVVYHFLLAVIIFLPCLVNGSIFIGSEDNYTHHFANLFFNLKSAQHGDLGLWNPYIYGGTNFSASTHNFIFYPFNWMIFLFPPKFFLSVLTFRIFLETWAIGYFGFLLFKEEIKNVRWALFASTIYLMGGHTILGLTIYANLTVTLWITIGAYLVFSLARRSCVKSFLYLTFTVLCLHFCFNIVYSLAGLLILSILFIYKFFETFLKIPCRWKYTATFILGMLTGTMISLIKLFPVLYRILFEGTRIANTNFEPLHHGILFFLSAFIPETFGVNMNQSLQYLTEIGGKPVSSHVETFSYFGILPIFLIFYSFFHLKDKKILFWMLYLSIISLWFLNIHPVVDILNKLTYPLIHVIIPKIMIPIPLCILAGLMAKKMDDLECRLDKKMSLFTWWLAGSVLAGIIFYTALTRNLSHNTFQLLMGGLVLLVVLVSALVLWAPAILMWIASSIPYIGLSVSVCILPWLDSSIDNIGVRNILTTLSIFSLGWIIGDLWLIPKHRWHRLCLGVVVSIISIITLRHYWPAATIQYLGAYDQIPFCLLGILKAAALLSFFAYWYQRLSSSNRLQQNFFVLCLVIVLFDLIPFMKTWLHVVIQKPFIKSSVIYPNIDRNLSKFDLANYRLNKPRSLLGIESKEQFTNMVSIYAVRTFGGADSEVPPLQRKLFEFFGEDHLLFVNGILPASTNERLLTIFGCAYDIDEHGKRFTRDAALSRFQIFTDYKTVEDDQKMLEQIIDPSFVPEHTVIIDQNASFNPNTKSHQTFKLKYQTVKQSRLTLKTTFPFPSILFFGDSFDPGWTATVNTKEVPIMRADYKFMAIELPAGEANVEFKFMPKTYVIGKWLTLGGLVLFVVAGMVLRKFKKESI